MNFEGRTLIWLEKFEILGLIYAPSTKALYEDMNQLVEKISSILYLAFVIVMPQCTIWPKFLLSFAKYFTTNLNGDAFELPIPVW